MSYPLDILDLPPELQRPMIRLIESFRQSLYAELAIRREDFDRLRDAVVELAEAQKRTEQRVEELAEAQKRTEQRVEELAEAQKRTEQRLDHLEAVVADLIEAQKRTEQRIEELTEAQKHTEQILQGLIRRVDRMDERLGRLVGESLERRYRERAFAYFGAIMRRIRVVSLQDVLADVEDRLTEAEVGELLPLDALIHGRVRQMAQQPEVWLALEVSAVVDRGDVERTRRRAALLRKAGLSAIPVAAGEEITDGARQLAQRENVMLLRDGQRLFWEEALADIITA